MGKMMKNKKKIIVSLIIILGIICSLFACVIGFKLIEKSRIFNIKQLEILNLEENSNIENEKEKIINDKKFVHVSIDDFIDSFRNIYENNYDSIFENPTFNQFKYLHETYGTVISCYCFYTDNNGFSLADFPEKYVQEFKENSDWLKFGFHSYDGQSDYGFLHSYRLKSDYDKIINELLRITGSYESIDRVVRIQGYYGNMDNIELIKDTECGIVGLLGADDKRRSYYLDDVSNSYLYLYDYLQYNGINFFKTDIRVEKIDDVDSVINELLNEKEDINEIVVLFTHEWKLTEENLEVFENLNKCCKKLEENGYVFDYPMNRIN